MLDRRAQKRECPRVSVRAGRLQGAVQAHTEQTDTPRELIVLQLLDPATRTQRRLTDEKARRQPSRGIPQQDLRVLIRHDRDPPRSSPARTWGTAWPDRKTKRQPWRWMTSANTLVHGLLQMSPLTAQPSRVQRIPRGAERHWYQPTWSRYGTLIARRLVDHLTMWLGSAEA